MTAPPLVIADVGNTALKLVAFGPRGSPRLERRVPFGPGFGAALRRAWPRSLPAPAAVVSVNGAHLAALERALGIPRLPVLGRDLPIPLPNRTAAPEETGIDRLCAAAAAHARAGGAAVAVGVGTALTVDAVDGGGAFLGGSIGPGLRSAAAGLAAAAPGLPAADLAAGRRAPYPGRTTAEALRAGFLRGFAGAVDRLAAEAAEAAAGPAPSGRRRGAPPPVFVHGGDAPAILPFLALPVIAAPLLVAEGARLLLLRGR